MHATVLKYFVEVARCGSIRKAAQNLFVASSAVNRQILKLEQELGTELFDRLPNGTRLNAAGQRVLQHVRATLHDFHLVRTELDAIKGERTGHISIVSMDSLFVDFLPVAIEQFSEMYPAVTYAMFAKAPNEVPECVASGEFDIGICFANKLTPNVDLVASVAMPPGVLMPPSHPLASQATISYADCARHAFLASGGISPLASVASEGFSTFWDSLSSRITCNSATMIKRMIINGQGIAILSKIAFMAELESGDVVWRPLAAPEINQLRTGIIVSKHRQLPYVAQQFIDIQIRRLKQLEALAERF